MMAVITISREFASGGDQVAERLCEELGYHAFGKVQIAQAVAETSMSKWNAVDYSEDNHEVQTFLERLFRRTATPVQTIAWRDDPSIATRPERADVHELAVISIVKRAIKAAQQFDNMVIVGRGGQVLLKGAPGVLHVRIEAPLEQRIQRVMEQLNNEQKLERTNGDLLRAANELVAKRDVASADYIRRYYDVNWADPKLYHLVLNLGLLDVETAVALIVTAVKAEEKL
jgi:cytidylate kinase